jgi:hypothetical protein
LIRKGARIVAHRLRTQGLRTTLLWMYARGLPKLTGIPIARYSRVTPHLYVGPQYGRHGKRRLEWLGITASINLREEFDDAAHGLAFASYCHLPTEDDAAPTLADLERGISFIREALGTGGKVYIHCAGGVGRAPTMAAAYLISEGLKRDEAIALIRRARPFIDITPPQLAQLAHFESCFFRATEQRQ